MAWKPAKHSMFGDTVYISVGGPYIANKKGGSEPAARCTEQGWRPRWLPFVFFAGANRSLGASGALCAAARARVGKLRAMHWLRAGESFSQFCRWLPLTRGRALLHREK